MGQLEWHLEPTGRFYVIEMAKPHASLGDLVEQVNY